MSKFKPGDRVVRTGSWMNGSRGTIVRERKGNNWDIELDPGFDPPETLSREEWAWNEDFMILETVYESTLYKALNEDEE